MSHTAAPHNIISHSTLFSFLLLLQVRTTNRPERWVVRSSAQGGQMAQGNNNNNQTAQEGMVAGM
jgi:hypothetical protein